MTGAQAAFSESTGEHEPFDAEVSKGSDPSGLFGGPQASDPFGEKDSTSAPFGGPPAPDPFGSVPHASGNANQDVSGLFGAPAPTSDPFGSVAGPADAKEDASRLFVPPAADPFGGGADSARPGGTSDLFGGPAASADPFGGGSVDLNRPAVNGPGLAAGAGRAVPAPSGDGAFSAAPASAADPFGTSARMQPFSGPFPGHSETD